MSRDVIKQGEFRSLYGTLLGEGGEAGAAYSSLTERLEFLERELSEAPQREARKLKEATARVREEEAERARTEYEGAVSALREATAEVARVARSEFEIAQEEVIELATGIAGRILRREIRGDDEFVVKMVRRCLRKIIHKASVRIRVNPEDYERVAAAESGFAADAGVGEIVIVEDRRVERGGCVVETPDFVVDATLHSQLAAARAALQGDTP